MPIRSEKPVDLSLTLELVRTAIGVSHAAFAEMLKMTAKEYERFQKKQLDVSLVHIFGLLEHVNLSFENIMKGNIDYHALSAEFRDHPHTVAEKYQTAAFSKSRTIHNVLRFLETYHGWQAAENVVRHFQIPESVLESGDAKINIRMIADIYDYISKYYIHASVLNQLGTFSRIANTGTIIEKTLSTHTNIKLLYENVFDDLITRFDENFDYSILSMKGTLIQLKAAQKEEIAEALQLEHISSKAGCTIRGGVTASFAGYMGISNAHTREVKCVHRGDPICLYEIDIERPLYDQKMGTTRPSSRPSTLLQ